ncbi:carboxypeptidase-like regulatory domain-containing protein [Tundrisphaera sp. TA3]|uniref:carboxypeptidase-like regulatory domain-containing protein n=1 Tax=Tundrisphaera sp. TA3 TaxID=3435775 RepID=UPI003EB7AC23
MTQRRLLWTAVLTLTFGCMGAESEDDAGGPDFSNLVPVSGVITLNGEPLQGAVITFLPKAWSPGLGETDAKGEYTVTTSNRPGISPGEYKVAISLLLSPENVPQGIGPRSSMSPPPSMLNSRELLPREYTDLSASKLTARVEKAGDVFNFDVKAPGLVIPARVEGPPAAAPEPEKPAARGNDDGAGEKPASAP